MYYRIEQFIKQTHRSGIMYYRIEQFIKQTHRSGIMYYRIEQFIKQTHRSGIMSYRIEQFIKQTSMGGVHCTSNISKRQKVVGYLLQGLAEQDRCSLPRVSKLSIIRPTSANRNVTIKIPLEKRPPCWPHKLKGNDEQSQGLAAYRTKTWSHDTFSLMTICLSAAT